MIGEWGSKKKKNLRDVEFVIVQYMKKTIKNNVSS